jgi:predicted nucleotide-binding protein
MELYRELDELIVRLRDTAREIEEPGFNENLTRLEDVAKEFRDASSGSWLGYHSQVYYKDFKRPPPGSFFNVVGGFMGLQSDQFQSRGHWLEYDMADVEKLLLEEVGRDAYKEICKRSEDARKVFSDARQEALSILELIPDSQRDARHEHALSSVTKKVFPAAESFLKKLRPPPPAGGTHDIRAFNGGMRMPVHGSYLLTVASTQASFAICEELAVILDRYSAHVLRRKLMTTTPTSNPTRIFIGHGHSPAWRDLKDFICDRLHLKHEEFERVPGGGLTVTKRLEDMIDNSCFAFIVMTAEDDMGGDRMRARQNVVHEAGLFQGKLGFSKAVLLVEEGVEQFSNSQGLVYVKFEKGKIRAVFDDVRAILEREGIIKAI